jgi:hypothetical protein
VKPVKPTVHEMLQFNELLRMQSTEVLKMQAMLPMLSDPDLRQEVQACVQADSAQVKAIVDFCKTEKLAH